MVEIGSSHPPRTRNVHSGTHGTCDIGCTSTKVHGQTVSSIEMESSCMLYRRHNRLFCHLRRSQERPLFGFITDLRCRNHLEPSQVFRQLSLVADVGSSGRPFRPYHDRRKSASNPATAMAPDIECFRALCLADRVLRTSHTILCTNR